MPRPTATQRGYDGAWAKAKAGFLAKHPFCAKCAAHGRVTKAEAVDHIVAHKGNMRIFWDKANWQPLCGPHHNAWKQKVERTGRPIGCDAEGWPAG